MKLVTGFRPRTGLRSGLCFVCRRRSARLALYLLYEAAKRLDVYPMWTIVKVDDTPVGIEAESQLHLRLP